MPTGDPPDPSGMVWTDAVGWHHPSGPAPLLVVDLRRLLKIVATVVDRHIEKKVPGHSYMTLPIMPEEMKELRSALEPFRPINQHKTT